MDESYFGGRHKYNRGRSVKSKIPVFGLLKRNGKVYTQIVPDVKRETLMKIIRTKKAWFIPTAGKAMMDWC